MTASVSVAGLDVLSERAVCEVRLGLTAHLPSLRAHARKLCRRAQPAEDLVQETVLRALVFARTFTPGTNLRAWLHQVLDSVFISSCRRGSRERRAFEALGRDPCAWVQPDVLPEMVSFSPRVQQALSQLPRAFRDVVELVDVQEQPYRAAADRLAVPIGTVMSRLYRGRRLLAALLADARLAA